MKCRIFLLSILGSTIIFAGCQEKSSLSPESDQSEQGSSLFRVSPVPGSPLFMVSPVRGSAKAKGIIPSGEYAGQRFKIKVSGDYSGIGPASLINGSAVITIGAERFDSIVSPAFGTFDSFCCGEGATTDDGSAQTFTVFGQVRHVTAAVPHNHLFAAFGSTEGTMNFNIVDQSGTIVTPTVPPHDPGIGLINEIPAVVKVKIM